MGERNFESLHVWQNARVFVDIQISSQLYKLIQFLARDKGQKSKD